jgi:hypothetical protein
VAKQNISRAAATKAERREGPRYRVLLVAKLVTTTDEQPVKIRDISTWGAMVEGGKLFSKGTDLILQRGATEIFAKVSWNNGRRCGLEFDDALSAAELTDFIKQSAKTAAEVADPFVKAGIAPEPLTAEQWAIIKAWGNTAGRDALGE